MPQTLCPFLYSSFLVLSHFLLLIFILTSVSKLQWKFSSLKKPYLSISTLHDLSLLNSPIITQHNIYVIYHKTHHVIIQSYYFLDFFPCVLFLSTHVNSWKARSILTKTSLHKNMKCLSLTPNYFNLISTCFCLMAKVITAWVQISNWVTKHNRSK